MAKDGMKRSVYFQADPTFNAVWARWRKEEQRAKAEKRTMVPFRVMGIVRMLIKRAGYRLISDIEIMQDYMEPKEIYGFCIGNVIKYILRSRFKGTELQDIEKAHQYLKWGIDVLHGEKINVRKEKHHD